MSLSPGCTTAVLLALIGLKCGEAISARRTHRQRLACWLQWLIVSGSSFALTSLWIPVNKKLFSLSFVLLTASIAICALICVYTCVDILGLHSRLVLLRVLSSAGKNSVLLYVGHALLAQTLPWHFRVDEQSRLALLAQLAWLLLLWLALAHFLAARRVFVKV